MHRIVISLPFLYFLFTFFFFKSLYNFISVSSIYRVRVHIYIQSYGNSIYAGLVDNEEYRANISKLLLP
jgi:hypothetical protein